jgi:hypothetical protein
MHPSAGLRCCGRRMRNLVARRRIQFCPKHLWPVRLHQFVKMDMQLCLSLCTMAHSRRSQAISLFPMIATHLTTKARRLDMSFKFLAQQIAYTRKNPSTTRKNPAQLRQGCAMILLLISIPMMKTTRRVIPNFTNMCSKAIIHFMGLLLMLMPTTALEVRTLRRRTLLATWIHRGMIS